MSLYRNSAFGTEYQMDHGETETYIYVKYQVDQKSCCHEARFCAISEPKVMVLQLTLISDLISIFIDHQQCRTRTSSKDCARRRATSGNETGYSWTRGAGGSDFSYAPNEQQSGDLADWPLGRGRPIDSAMPIAAVPVGQPGIPLCWRPVGATQETKESDVPLVQVRCFGGVRERRGSMPPTHFRDLPQTPFCVNFKSRIVSDSNPSLTNAVEIQRCQRRPPAGRPLARCPEEPAQI